MDNTQRNQLVRIDAVYIRNFSVLPAQRRLRFSKVVQDFHSPYRGVSGLLHFCRLFIVSYQ